MKLKTSLVALALALAATGANATVQHYTVTEAGTAALNPVDGNPSQTAWDQTLSVDKYNLGYTLVGVSVTLKQVVDLVFNATNNAATYVGADVGVGHPIADALASTMSAQLYGSSNPLDALYSVNLVTTTGTIGASGVVGHSFATGVLNTFNVTEASTQDTAYWSTVDVLAGFTGTTGGADTLTMEAYANGTQSNHMNNNFTLHTGSWSQALVDVTYYYDVPSGGSAPEPATLALVGLALLSSVSLRRRRK